MNAKIRLLDEIATAGCWRGAKFTDGFDRGTTLNDLWVARLLRWNRVLKGWEITAVGCRVLGGAR